MLKIPIIYLKMTPFTLSIDSESLNKVSNKINPEILIECYCLTQHDFKICKINWKVVTIKLWQQISGIILPDDLFELLSLNQTGNEYQPITH
jgi:hypothetical protein